jgi:predicted permease
VTGALPAPLRGLLSRAIPRLRREAVLGDLEERYREQILPYHSRLTAYLWLWREALLLAAASFWSLLRYRKTRESDVVLAADRMRRHARTTGRFGQSRNPFDDLIPNLRQSLRSLRRQPAFAAVIIVTLALGIGANIAIFGLVNAMLLRPLPFPESDRLVSINHIYPSVNLVSNVSVRGFTHYRDETSSFEEMAVTSGWVVNLTGQDRPERLVGGRVSWDYFDVFGVAPALGRGFRPEEDIPGENRVVLLSDGTWQSRFGGEADILGRTLTLNGEPYTVIGVMPEGFRDYYGWTRELWTPLALTQNQLASDNIIYEWLRLVARLAPGATLEGARAELHTMAERLKQDPRYTPILPEGWTLRVTTLAERARAGYRSSLVLLLAAVGIVLLLACANVANLLLARAIQRRREIAIRRSLGAGRRRLVAQLLTESLVLAGLGGLAGLAVAWATIRSILAFGPPAFAQTGIGVDLRLVLFALGVTLFTGLLFGLAPIFQAARLDIQKTLREGGLGSAGDRGGHRLRSLLVTAEFGMALLLLAGAGLLIRSLERINRIDPGFDVRNILTANLSLPAARYGDAPAQAAFFEQLQTRLETVPGVTAAAISSFVPFSGSGFTSIFNVEGYTPESQDTRPWGDIRIVSAGLEQVLRMPLLQGRFFEPSDRADSQPVIVVDEVMVERFWPDTDPIGKRITFHDLSNPNAVWFSVVGVVGHTTQAALVEDTHLQVYFNATQNPNGSASVLIRTNVDALSLVSALRETVLSIDEELPIAAVNTIEDLKDASLGDRRTTLLLLVVFAALAALLAALGIYGVMSHAVGERTREFGVRMACGATRIDLIRMVLRSGLVLAGIGTGAGLVVSLLLAGSIRSQLYEVSPLDPLTLGAVTLLILLVAGVSTLLPALRTARLQPTICLRQE